MQASVPIWEGGRIAAESLEASVAVRQSEFALKQIRNAIEREYEFAGIEMKSRYDQIEFAWDEVRLGKDEFPKRVSATKRDSQTIVSSSTHSKV